MRVKCLVDWHVQPNRQLPCCAPTCSVVQHGVALGVRLRASKQSVKYQVSR